MRPTGVLTMLAPAVAALAVVLAIGLGADHRGRGRAGAGAPGGSATTACATSSFSLEPLAQARRQAERMLKRMTLDQEVTLMHGVGQAKAPSGTIGATAAIPALGIPAINQQDGPAGIGDVASGVTQLPAPEALAATFDPAAAACYGQVIGAQARGKGINLVYGPTVNIVRVPQWGRAFESLGEDPTLTGTIGAAEVDGIQRTGTMAQVKHFAVYNQETNRTQRHKTTPWSVRRPSRRSTCGPGPRSSRPTPARSCAPTPPSTARGACQDKTLIDGYLDTTLGFSGFVGSDYLATHSTVASVEAGLDQEQPTATYLGSALVAAVEDGQVPRATVDQAALTDPDPDVPVPALHRRRQGGPWMTTWPPRPTAEVANDVAEEGTVLLKNAHHALPLAKGGPGRHRRHRPGRPGRSRSASAAAAPP